MGCWVTKSLFSELLEGLVTLLLGNCIYAPPQTKETNSFHAEPASNSCSSRLAEGQQVLVTFRVWVGETTRPSKLLT